METYTFSRALHLMRYGGKKMRCLAWEDKTLSIKTIGNTFTYESDESSGIVGSWNLIDFFHTSYIMGTWVEVK